MAPLLSFWFGVWLLPELEPLDAELLPEDEEPGWLDEEELELLELSGLLEDAELEPLLALPELLGLLEDDELELPLELLDPLLLGLSGLVVPLLPELPPLDL